MFVPMIAGHVLKMKDRCFMGFMGSGLLWSSVLTVCNLTHTFTEQGIYMLMTVLKGEVATKQSKALIRTFKQMKPTKI